MPDEPAVDNPVPNTFAALSPLQNGDVINRLSTFCVAQVLKIASLFSVLPDLLVPRELLSRVFRGRSAAQLKPWTRCRTFLDQTWLNE
jgi:hypothetical protein